MRFEANAAQYSQQIEQLKAMATDVLRQVKAKPAEEQPREVSTPRSLRPKADPIEGKLTVQQSKFLNDVFKLADVSVKFNAPKSDFAQTLAQKSDELNQLSRRLLADDARFAKEFSAGVKGLQNQYEEDADNIADAKAMFDDDDRNKRALTAATS